MELRQETPQAMTIICYKDGVLAADSGTTGASGGFCSCNVMKITRSPSGWLGGFAGRGATATKFLNWLERRDDDPAEGPDLTNTKDEETGEGLLVDPTGSLYWLSSDGVITPMQNEFAAIGSAEGFALGAMHAGASAEEAVRLVIENCNYCWGPIETLALDPLEEM